jgi:hypothetical protein
MDRFRFVAPHLLGDVPHVMVDGAPRRATVYTVSHWPRTPTPTWLVGDLSTEMALQARRYPERLPGPVEVASIDHYDTDGIIALALLVLDGLDEGHGPLLVEAARVGDFDVVTDRRAALVAFALQALEDVDPAGARRPAPSNGVEQLAVVADDALGVLPDLVADPGRFAYLWGAECAAYDASLEAMAAGHVTIEEIPELDLAIVRVGHDDSAAHWKGAPLHRAAVHSATSCLRVATVVGARMELRYRYESWVRLATRRPRPRVDLERLAAELAATETAPNRWVFDGAGALRGALHLARADAASTIHPERFLDLLTSALAVLDAGPPAWDPYDDRR